MLQSLLNVQANKIYEGKNENAINDGIRDQLRMVYEVKDQTRQGNSVSGKDAGEIDLILCDNGNPAVILEGLKLDSLSTNKLDEHINKALTNYEKNKDILIQRVVMLREDHIVDDEAKTLIWNILNKPMNGGVLISVAD